MIVEKEIGFDYGHRLPNHHAACRFVHGHRAKVIVAVEGVLLDEEGASSEGMVIDFKDIKRIATEKIHDVLDHGFVVYEHDAPMLEFLQKNEQRYYILSKVPTAENLAKWCYDQIKDDIEQVYEGKLKVSSIKFWETPSSMALYEA